MNEYSSSAPAALALPPDVVMLQMFTGFQVSQAVYVVAKLDIATILAEKGPRDIGQLAAEAGADADALGRVIRFLASLGVFRTNGDTVEITELGALLAAGPGQVDRAVCHAGQRAGEASGQLDGRVDPAAGVRP
jgi:hypothetical protein